MNIQKMMKILKENKYFLNVFLQSPIRAFLYLKLSINSNFITFLFEK